MRQIIIARKDLHMSPGKLAAQVSHASIAFISKLIRENAAELCDGEVTWYKCNFLLNKDIYEQWFKGAFVKTVCEAKNRSQLMKAAAIAEEMGMKECQDFFLIKDNCLTELRPEEIDENGIGRTLTCIGFRPLPDDIAHQISKKYQLLK